MLGEDLVVGGKRCARHRGGDEGRQGDALGREQLGGADVELVHARHGQDGGGAAHGPIPTVDLDEAVFHRHAGVDDGDLYFKPVGEPTSRGAEAQAVDLRWGDTLEEFEVSRTTGCVRAAIRRWQRLSLTTAPGEDSVVRTGPLTINREAQTVSKRGEQIRLTRIEMLS